MNILLCCHQFFPRFYTGTETLVLEVADELKTRGHNVSILSTEPILQGDRIPLEPELVKEQFNGHVVYKLLIPPENAPLIRINREAYDETLINLFDRVLNETRPDICHVYHLMRLTSSLIDSVYGKKIPIFFTSTDYWLICPMYQLIRHNGKLCTRPGAAKCFACICELYTKGMNETPIKFKMAYSFPQMAALVNKDVKRAQQLLGKRLNINQNIGRCLDGIFYSNRFMQDLFHRNKIYAAKEHLLEFPIPKRSENVCAIRPINAQGPLKVAFIGTLRPSKGPQVFIKACNLLKDRNDVAAKIWGAPESSKKNSYLDSLKQLADQTKWVEFCGTFNQDEFPNVLEETDVVVIPSIWYENTPLTALSALAAKRVIIVSNLGGLSTLVKDGISGYIFPAGDYKKLAEIIQTLAQNRNKIIEIVDNIKLPHSINTYVDFIENEYRAGQEKPR